MERGAVSATASLLPLHHLLDRRARARRLHGVVTLALVRIHVVLCAL